MGRAKADYSDREQEIISKLDILAEYRGMGLVIAGQPRSSGKVECYSAFREENKPSSWIDLTTGLYGDSGSGEKAISIWEFAARKGLFPDWKAARESFAAKAGISLARRPKLDPLEQLEFHDWGKGDESLATFWCRKHKRGLSLDSLKLAGARIAQYPCRIDKASGQRVKGEFKVIALPCWDHRLPPAEPCAWVIYNIGGGTLPVYRGKGIPPEQVKMKSVGATRGATMNLHALQVLADPARSAGIELLWKTGGPSDMLAVLAAILRDSPDLIDRHLVLTNASSETGDVLPHQAAMFAGRRTIVVNDADEAGEAGTLKWQQALAGVASELRCLRLPWAVQKKHGKDARDFLNGDPLDLLGAMPLRASA